MEERDQPAPRAPSPSDVHEIEDLDPQVGDIRIEYHPHSKQPTIIKNLEDYFGDQDQAVSEEDIDLEPWRDFGTRDNFEFAEWALEAELNQRQIEKVFTFINRLRSGVSDLTLRSYQELADAWAIASESQPAVFLSNITF